jgi:hypothetical protein
MLSRPYGACPTFVCVPRTGSQNRRTCPGLLSVVLRDLREGFAEESPELLFGARGRALFPKNAFGCRIPAVFRVRFFADCLINTETALGGQVFFRFNTA